MRPNLSLVCGCGCIDALRSGVGDFYGTVGGKTPYIPQGGEEVKKTKDNVTRQLPNMVTNPCKKGTYGVFGTYLGYKKVAAAARHAFEACSHATDTAQGLQGCQRRV